MTAKTGERNRIRWSKLEARSVCDTHTFSFPCREANEFSCFPSSSRRPLFEHVLHFSLKLSTKKLRDESRDFCGVVEEIEENGVRRDCLNIVQSEHTSSLEDDDVDDDVVGGGSCSTPKSDPRECP